MKPKFARAYMDVAHRFSQLSHAQRLQVGAIIVKDDRIISIGYNGMPAGWNNNCEDKIYIDPEAGGWLSPEEIWQEWPFEDLDGQRYKLVTKPEVLHAESNALAKLARTTESGENAVLFVTHSPCLNCAKLIFQSGITTVYYDINYRDSSGIEFLEKSGVIVERVDNNG